MGDKSSKWIGVDLDGTLAKMEGWQGPTEIGEPIKPMVDRVKQWLKKGRTVKIMTARAATNDKEVINAIKKWCKQHIGQELEVTNVKDLDMAALFDDKAFRVEKNTGKIL
jgi:hypothetical protein